MLESALQTQVRKDGLKRGWAGMKCGQNGKPDYHWWKRGRHLWFEYKIWPNKPTPLQNRKISELREQGELVYVIYTREEATAAFIENDPGRNSIDFQGL